MSEIEKEGINAPIIDETKPAVQSNGKPKGKSKKGAKSKKSRSEGLHYTMESTMRSVSIKIYDEQIVLGMGSAADKATIDNLRANLKASIDALPTDKQGNKPQAAIDALREHYESQLRPIADKYVPLFFTQIQSIDNTKMEVAGICHDRDHLTNDFFLPALEKRHYHILGFAVGDYGYKLRSWLNTLGIAFDNETDSIFKSIETVSHKCEMLRYLTHDTEEAIKDGKYHYTDDELITNLDTDTLNRYRSRFFSLTTKALSFGEISELADNFYNLGYSAQSFDNSYNALAAHLRLDKNLKSMLRDTYQQGLVDNVNNDPEIDRLCIYIEGQGNTSKSYSAFHACKELYGSVFTVDGGRTGSFDDYQIDTQSLVVNDYFLPNILNVCDNKKAKLYRRNKNNPYCLARVVVVTGNKPFSQWLSDCNISDSSQAQAMGTRFFICRMEQCGEYHQARLVRMPKTVRGDYEAKVLRFLTFIETFNRIAATYRPMAIPELSADINSRLEALISDRFDKLMVRTGVPTPKI